MAAPIRNRERAALLFFAFQAPDNDELIILNGTDNALLEQYSFADVVNIKVGDNVYLLIAPNNDLVTFHTLFVGSEEELETFKNSIQSKQGSSQSAQIEALINIQRAQEIKIENLEKRILECEELLKTKKTPRENKRAKINNVGKLEVVVNNIKQPLNKFIKNSSELLDYLATIKRSTYDITNKFNIDMENSLKYLRSYIAPRLQQPSKCGYAVMLELLPLSVFCKLFLPVEESITRTRSGRITQKKVANLSLQRLFREILLWCGANVFTEHSITQWMQLAVDGVNSRVDLYNSIKKQKSSMNPKFAPIWTSLESVDAWDNSLNPQKPSAISDNVEHFQSHSTSNNETYFYNQQY